MAHAQHASLLPKASRASRAPGHVCRDLLVLAAVAPARVELGSGPPRQRPDGSISGDDHEPGMARYAGRKLFAPAAVVSVFFRKTKVKVIGYDAPHF
jgi:hypothetical protein